MIERAAARAGCARRGAGWWRALGGLLVATLSLPACTPRDAVVVGGKNFTEQRVLGELLAQTIEAAGIPVDRRLDLGGTLVCDRALRAGEVDVYVEYTGTAMRAILHREGAAAPSRLDGAAAPSGLDGAAAPGETLALLRAAYAPAGLTWLEPLGFDNTFALVLRPDTAAAVSGNGPPTISAAAPAAAGWVAGVGYEFQSRQDGLPGLAEAYGLRFREVKTLDLGLLYRALGERQIDLAVGSSTDGPIERLGLVVLEDDRHFFPRYDAVPVVREAALARHPGLRAALGSLAGRLDARTMRALNERVDGAANDPAVVVREWRAHATSQRQDPLRP